MAAFFTPNNKTSSGHGVKVQPKKTDNLVKLGYLPASDGYELQKYGPDDIVITYDCCPAPVFVGILTELDRRMGYKELPAVEFLHCPAGCCGDVDFKIRRPSSVVLPVAKAGFKHQIHWQLHPNLNVSRAHILLESYDLTAQDIVPNEQGTYPITQLDVDHIPVDALILGWRVCPKVEGEEKFPSGMMQILKREPGYTGFYRTVYGYNSPDRCPFKLSQEETDAGWRIVEYKQTGFKKN